MSERPQIMIDGIDIGPDDLAAQLPRTAELLRLIPGPDRPDYALAAVTGSPLTFETTFTALREGGIDPATADPRMIRVAPDGERVQLEVFGLVLAPRNVGDRMHPAMNQMPVMLAYVVDNTVLRDESLDFAKCYYAAVAFISSIPEGRPPSSTGGPAR